MDQLDFARCTRFGNGCREREFARAVVAGEAARMVMERKFPFRGGVEQLDAARLYVEHSMYFSKYLVRCHKALVPEGALKL